MEHSDTQTCDIVAMWKNPQSLLRGAGAKACAFELWCGLAQGMKRGQGYVVGSMEEFAKPFYQSQEWKSARAAYLKKVGGLCERCLKKGLYNAAVIVHHHVHLTPDTIRDPKIRTGFDNLEAL